MMKKIFTTFSIALFMFCNAQNQTSAIDNTFATNGIFHNTFESNGQDYIKMKILPDGKILYLGDLGSATGSNDDYYISKFNVDGSLDTTFGTNGYVYLEPQSVYGPSFQVGSDGSIYVVANNYNGTTSPSSDIKVLKLNANGTVNSTYSNTVPQLVSSSSFVLLPDNKIIFGANNHNGTQYLVRLNSDGTLDSSFGTNGKVSVAYPIQDVLLTQDNLNLVISINTGINIGDTLNYYGISKFNTNGQIDTNFANNGNYIIQISGSSIELETSIKLDTSGNIYSLESDFTTFSRIRKLTPNGTLDATFANGGIVNEAPSNIFLDLEFGSDSKLYFGGLFYDTANDVLNPLIARYTTAGVLDTTLNTTGYIKMNDVGYRFFENVEIQSDGKILAAGEYKTATKSDLFLMRYIITNNLSTVENYHQDNVFIENPTFDKLKIKSNKQIKTVELLSTDGKIVKRINGFNNSADLSGLQKGLYFVKITLEDGTSVVKKLIKN